MPQGKRVIIGRGVASGCAAVLQMTDDERDARKGEPEIIAESKAGNIAGDYASRAFVIN